MATKNATVLDARAVERTLKRMAVEIVELNRGTDDLIIVGIQRRGVQLADRLVKMIEGGEGVTVPQGSLDITLYRDDLQTVGPRPVVGPTYLPWELDGRLDNAHVGCTVGAEPQGAVATTLSRGGPQPVGPRPVVGPTCLPWELAGKHVVILDHVLYAGRTVRAALHELADVGRPAN